MRSLYSVANTPLFNTNTSVRSFFHKLNTSSKLFFVENDFVCHSKVCICIGDVLVSVSIVFFMFSVFFYKRSFVFDLIAWKVFQNR